MKGLLLSFFLFFAYFVGTALYCHFLKPRRHGPVFILGFFIITPIYFALYLLTSSGLGFLPDRFQAANLTIDLLFGYAVLALNIHSLADFFFAVNGGFSASLLLEIHQAREKGLPVESLIQTFKEPSPIPTAQKKSENSGLDPVYGWRIPRLLQRKYLIYNAHSENYSLTLKGRWAAKVGMFLKGVLNLGKGG